MRKFILPNSVDCQHRLPHHSFYSLLTLMGEWKGISLLCFRISLVANETEYISLCLLINHMHFVTYIYTHCHFTV